MSAAIMQPKHVYAGEDKTFRVTITEGGKALDLSGATVEFQVKGLGGAADPPLIAKTSAVGGEIDILDQTAGLPTVGQVDINLVPSDTSPTPSPSFYRYDIVLIKGSGKRHEVVPPNDFEIRAVVNPV